MKNNTINYVSMGNEAILKNSISTDRKKTEYTAKIKAGSCVICDMIEELCGENRVNGYKRGTNRVETSSHKRGVHICSRHFNDINSCLLNYSFEGVRVSGTPTAKCISNSIEFETMHNDILALITMVADHHYTPTEDCTVEVEYKSPIYLSLQGLTKSLGAIEYLAKNNHFAITENCGTHLHTSIYRGIRNNGKPISKYDYTELGEKEVYEALFFPICEYFDSMSYSQLIKFFGSDFRHYAQNPIDNPSYDYTENHSAIFNVQHDYSLEFRLPRFCGAEKYRKIVLFMQEVVVAVSLYQENIETPEKVGEEIAKIGRKYFSI